VRAVLELAGIHDILSKSLGTQNPINLVKATVAGLRGLRTPEEVAKLRGLTIDQVLGLTDKHAATATEVIDGAAPAEGSEPVEATEAAAVAPAEAEAAAPDAPVAEQQSDNAEETSAPVEGATAPVEETPA